MKVLFYYRGSEHFGVQALIAYIESKVVAEPWKNKIDRNKPIKDSA